MGVNVDVTIFGLEKADVKEHMGDNSTIGSGRDLIELFKYILRTRPATPSNLDLALDGLRRLNLVHADIKKSHRRHQQRDDFVSSSPLWKETIEFVATNEPNVNSSTEASPIPPVATRPLPLFVLDNCFYPEGETWLHVFEPRYRAMMRDIAADDECFGYVFADGAGRLASTGTLCQVIFRQVREWLDGSPACLETPPPLTVQAHWSGT